MTHAHKSLLASCLIAIGGYSALAAAAVVGIARNADGQIELHDTAGPCVGTALTAIYRPTKPGEPQLAGCWVQLIDDFVFAFFDGVIAVIPREAIRQPVSV